MRRRAGKPLPSLIAASLELYDIPLERAPFLFRKESLTNTPASISTLFQCCLLVDMTSRRGTTSNQRWNNVVYFNVRFYKVESTLCISTLIWATLDTVETTLSFSTSSFTTLVNVETTFCKWPFLKGTGKKSFQIIYTEFGVFTAFS